LALLAALLAPGGPSAAKTPAKRVKKRPRPAEEPHGTLTESPKWSAGVQLGNYGATGLSAQKPAFFGGALDLGLGLAGGGVALSADYVRFLDTDLRPQSIAANSGYRQLAGELRPYGGIGLQVGKGAQLEMPLGVQYTMGYDPLNFYGGTSLLYGRFFSDSDLRLELWFYIGARLLL
jgi:hypothetical protein